MEFSSCSGLLEEARQASKERAHNVTVHRSMASLNHIIDNQYKYTIDHDHPKLTA